MSIPPSELESTERAKRRSVVYEREAYYRLLVQTSPDGIVLSDLNGTILIANAAAAGLYGGRDGDELIGTTVFDLVNEGDQPALRACIEEAVRAEHTQHVECGVRRAIQRSIVEFAISVATDAARTPMGFMTVARDITKHKQREEQLQSRALHDPLTGLPNRILLYDRLAQAIEGARRTKTQVSVLYIDLDHFKEVNDSFGHDFADILLRQTAHRMQGAMRGSDTLGRLGGDEFAAVLPKTDAVGARVIAGKLRDKLGTSFHIVDHAIDIRTSIGIAVYPVHGEDATTVLLQADVAMYTDKRTASVVQCNPPDDTRQTRGPLTNTSDVFAVQVDPRVLNVASAHPTLRHRPGRSRAV